MRLSHRLGVRLWSVLGIACLLAGAGKAQAQAAIKVNDVVYLKLGILLQAQADWLQLPNAANTETDGYQQNLFLRRVRLLFAGRVAPNVYFFAETDNPRLGYNKTSSTALASGFQLIDGLVEWRVDESLVLDGGLIAVPYSRLALMAVSRLLFLDVSAYGYLQMTSTQSIAGNRDTGFLARGYFADRRLEYRVGVFSGVRLPGVHNPFRVSGRLQWEFFDREDLISPSYFGPGFYAGAFLGTKKVLAVGTAFDTQMDFRYYSGDVFWSIPAGSAGSFEGLLQYQYLDGGVTFPTLPPENTLGADVGYYVRSLKFAPMVRVEQKTFNGQPEKNEWRMGLTLAYLPYGYNFNVKAAVTHVMPKTGVATNQFTIQLQVYYF
jgi:hypothetical protein